MISDEKHLNKIDNNGNQEKQYNDVLSIGSEENNLKTVSVSLKKKIIFWIYALILILFVITFSIILSYSWKPMDKFILTDNFYYANQITYEWNTGFITDIMILNSSEECPQGYQNSFSFEWSGVGIGCYCQQSTNLTFVLQGYCSPSLIQQNCRNIPTLAPRFAKYWRNSSNICIKRSQVSFANQNKYDGTNKICGSSSSLVIVPNSEPCPYVNISFNTFTLQNHTYTVTDSLNILPPLYGVYNSTSPYSFYSYPISKFKVSQFQFCLIDEDTGLDPDHSDFILLNSLRGCVQTGNFTMLDILTQIDFYANNPNLNELQNNKGFPSPGNWQYLFGFKNLPSWTYQCRHNYDKKFSISNTISQLNFTYYQTYIGVSVAILIFLIIIAVEVLLIVMNRCVNSNVYPAGYKQKYMLSQFLWAILRYIVDFIAKIVILCLMIYITVNAYYNWHWFKGVNNFNCIDGNKQMEKLIIQPYSELYIALFNYSIGMTILSAFMIVIDIFHFIFIYRNQLKHYLVQSQGKLLLRQQQDNDLGWMKDKEAIMFEQNNEVNSNQQFKMTMAQNMFGSQQISKQKIKKRKKKKFFGKKKDNQQQAKFSSPINSTDFDSFNPYELEQSIPNFGDSIKNDKIPSSPSRRKKK